MNEGGKKTIKKERKDSLTSKLSSEDNVGDALGTPKKDKPHGEVKSAQLGPREDQNGASQKSKLPNERKVEATEEKGES